MSPSLITAPNLEGPDDCYQALLDAHADLTPSESHALNARLVLLLANHVGSRAVLAEAIAAATRSLPAREHRSAHPQAPDGSQTG
jgi:hypothetical protein